MERSHALVVLALACLLLSSIPAQASESLKLSVSLKPEKLGQSSTVGFNFDILPDTGRIPPPLTEVDLRYPGDLGIGLSELGLATCSVRTLELHGAEGCPAEAHMGYGTVLGEILIEGEVFKEHASLAVLRAATPEGHISLYFYAEGHKPVIQEAVFPGALLPAEPPFGERLQINVPLVEIWTEGPYVSVTQIHGTLGPQHLTYYHHVGRKYIPYVPQGILLPKHCPRGGFRFTAHLGFLDGTKANASATVGCPPRR